LRIGIDASPLAVPFGGIRRYTEQIIQGLAGTGAPHDLVLFGPVKARIPGIDGVSWETTRHPLRPFLELVRLPGARGRIDLFHGPNYVAPLASPVPTVLTVHDLTVHLFPESHPRMRRLRHRLLPTICRRAVRLIADSHCTKNDLVIHYGIPSTKIDVVHLAAGKEFEPVSCSQTLQGIRTRLGLPDRFVLFVGSVEPRKNLPLLIRAMARLSREAPETALAIVGGGEPRYVASLHRIIEAEGLELGRDVIFTGCVGDQDLPALYSQCQVFVYPSRYEGFGLPPLEAMACGAPVLIPNHSSFVELYKDCGLLVDPIEVETLEAAIRRLLWDHTLRNELIARGLKLARSRTWQDVVAETLAVYRKTLA
jgi:glycosyltransferase involved in cell wall biosynthesis